jgi:spore maturation protein CgeB
VKILIIDGSADTSSRDTFDGYYAALKRAGHETYVYAASRRIAPAGNWLDYSWRQAKRINPDAPRPNTADVMYMSSVWSVEMALRIMPDWILVLSGMFFPMQAMALLRKASWPHCKMGLLICDSPFDDNQIVNCLGLYDAVFTNERASVPLYRQYNPASFYLPACYDSYRHRPDLPVPAEAPRHDVVFVGTAFTDRVATLSAVDWTGIDFGLYGNWEQLGSRSKLRRHLRGGPVPNDYAAALYRNAKIGLNLHRTRLSSPNVPLPPGMAQSLNPRAYELAACGVFQVSNERAEAYDVFGDSFPTFINAAELEAHIRYGLRHPEECARLSDLQCASAQGHTYDARAATLLNCLEGFPQVETEQEPRQLRSVS